MEYVLALIVLAGMVALFVAGPLRAGGPGEAHAGEPDEASERTLAGTAEPGVGHQVERRAELEAAKEAKYREIRDAELDFRMGKLSEEDFRATDRELRAQALAILRRLDELE